MGATPSVGLLRGQERPVIRQGGLLHFFALQFELDHLILLRHQQPIPHDATLLALVRAWVFN